MIGTIPVKKKNEENGMRVRRVMIAAPKSGSGKTVVTCALLRTWKERGLRVVSFKCGPDYIDPMFHENVLKIPSKNLDTFFTDEEGTKTLFADHTGEAEIAVTEGVMGLYDGLGGVREEGSSYHLARVTQTPIILVVDARGMGRSVISMIAGFLAYDRENLIRGVILNRASKGYYETMKPLLERELKVVVLGFLPEQEEFHIESRHLGLLLPDEVQQLKEKMTATAKLFSQTVSVERIVEIAESAGELEPAGTETENRVTEGAVKKGAEAVAVDNGRISYRKPIAGSRPVIAVARDEAFCFYYADNLRLLEEYGAEIKYFSPLWDKELPAGCHALLIGGGYPELYAEQLSRNGTMRESVRSAVENKMPVVAECGGFLYLHSSLTDKDGNCFEMAGVIPASCFYTRKLVRFGYIQLREKRSHFLPEGEIIKGHEFHYYDSTDYGADAIAVRPATGKESPCVIENEVQWMGFPHLYYPSNPAFAGSFVDKAVQFRKNFVRNFQTRKEGGSIEERLCF